MRKGCDGGKNGGEKKEKTDENSGHYVIASSRPPERRPLECRTLVPKNQRTLKEKKKGWMNTHTDSLSDNITFSAAHGS